MNNSQRQILSNLRVNLSLECTVSNLFDFSSPERGNVNYFPAKRQICTTGALSVMLVNAGVVFGACHQEALLYLYSKHT